MRILFLGDIVGRPGRTMVKSSVAELRNELELDMVIANGENASGGLGLSAKSAREIFGAGVDCITSGNHIWKFRDIYPYLNKNGKIIRPANYAPDVPGRGHTILEIEGLPKVAVINLQGRTFMPDVECPFRTLDAILNELPEDVKTCIVDFHAEATGEKKALAWHVDGRISALIGTHTHVQTSDAQVMPQGTAYITDAGMCGPSNSCLGMNPTPIINRFLTGMPTRFEVAQGPVHLQGTLFEIDDSTGLAITIKAWEKSE